MLLPLALFNNRNGMQIIINGKSVTTSAQYLGDLLQQMDQAPEGLAVAVAGQVVPRAQWASWVLKENDEVLLISVTRGG